MQKGLLIIYTGNGKGKTTAALGLVLRARGHGMRVCVVQFIKGKWQYGEIEGLSLLGELVELHIFGKGFTWLSKDMEKDKEAARYAFDFAKEAVCSGKYDMVVMDEFTYLINYKIIDEKDAVEFLVNRPKDVHVVITGRGASNALIEIADLVTQMQDIKHPYTIGIKAQKGIEF